MVRRMSKDYKYTTLLFLSVLYAVYWLSSCQGSSEEQNLLTANYSISLNQALVNGVLTNEGLERCRLYVDAWLNHADSQTGLIPRNLDRDRDIWNAKDAAADNYPFMVLTAALTDQELFQGKMKEMLQTEISLTSRLGSLPDTYSFEKQDFASPEINQDDILFGASEYIKDGLLPLTEWLGPSPWSERMLSILDDMWKYARIETPFGNIVSTNVEVNGELLQILSRVYWMTQDKKYLQWAIRLGDYYLLNDQHPTGDFEVLRLRDHGCEIVSGLCELYAAVSMAKPEKKKVYQPHIHEMLNKVLEVGRNEDGLFYNAVNPKTGEVLIDGTADNFGYTFNGFYTVYQIDSIAAYKQAVIQGLESLDKKYRNFDWESGSADGYADAIEGALNLYTRAPIESVGRWLDSEIKVMWAMQKQDGVIEGWHGDGNFARTTIMYCLWKSQGITIRPWRFDIELGAVKDEDELIISINVQQDWQGELIFDSPRHKTNMNMPWDWPRINQFPEWFTIDEDISYELVNLINQQSEIINAGKLNYGIKVSLKKGVNQFVLRKGVVKF